MNQDDAFKKLNKYLDAETEKFIGEKIAGRKKSSRTTCEKCPLNESLKMALKNAMLQEKASSSLKKRILDDL